MSGVNDIRSTFLNFFARHDHSIVPSSPLVPRNDPTLMFANSGMVQFKNVFTGIEKRPYVRATTAQKCVRAGGKHNDLDNVGYTARHHTFFEMLGNFSFGDYFKERAIELAWTLVTREFGLPKDRLLVTVYSEDDEAASFWRRIAGLGDDRIIRISTSDNFWRMGETGPCGPCSEIFFDHGPHIPGGPPGTPDEDGDRFIEIWNLVFMQFEEAAGGGRTALPRPSIDTGMGLERVAAVLQGKHDNYDIDLFRVLIEAIAHATGVDPRSDLRASHRVIADHLRCASFLIADGVLPSNEGRGYVLRRIMRRGMRHAHLLGARDPLLSRLVPVLVREMGQAYPELARAEMLIAETLRFEEIKFQKTLDRGLSLLAAETASLSAGANLPGSTAFKLYDTYGFPLDLTQDALRARGIGVDLEGFDNAMAQQKAEARANWAGSGEAASEGFWFAVRDTAGATEFLGYETCDAQATVVGLVRDGGPVSRLEAGQAGAIVCNQTPFYAESGGQVGDTGVIICEGGRFGVHDTQKRAGDMVVHLGVMEDGTMALGAPVQFHVDAERRGRISANHSATHLLHEALRRVLGDHVAQKGSLVEPDRLRFDISHTMPIADEDLARVEDLANAVILANAPVETRLMAVDDAIASGARALFGEKYGDEVRVVSMGRDGGTGRTYSVELCGGTHVQRTGDIGLLTVLGEHAVASGVRRIEALSGVGARRHLNAEARRVQQVAAALRTSSSEVLERVQTLAEERRRLEREVGDLRRQVAMGGSAAADGPRMIGTVPVVARQLAGIEAKDLKSLAEGVLARGDGAVAILVAVSEDGRASLVVAIDKALGSRANAVDLARVGAGVVGGKGGGGRPDMAQAGGPEGDKAEAAIEAMLHALEGALKG